MNDDLKQIKVYHNIAPVFDKNSKILVLGSFPSVKSRETTFFYGHKQNRFWKVLSYVFECDVPETIDEKKDLLLKNNIALWDVIKSCEIAGSSDNSIKNVVPNDISIITKTSKIRAILLNGKTSFFYYNKFIKPLYNIKSYCMSSTSPANASRKLDDLCHEWKSTIKMII